MNKSDIKLIIILLILFIPISLLVLINSSNGNKALVYYNNKLIKTIDLNINDKYTVNGYNGEINIEVKNKKIRVLNEISQKHLCSKQGFISSSYESIVCLPNKIVIKITNDNKLDTKVG